MNRKSIFCCGILKPKSNQESFDNCLHQPNSILQCIFLTQKWNCLIRTCQLAYIHSRRSDNYTIWVALYCCPLISSRLHITPTCIYRSKCAKHSELCKWSSIWMSYIAGIASTCHVPPASVVNKKFFNSNYLRPSMAIFPTNFIKPFYIGSTITDFSLLF